MCLKKLNWIFNIFQRKYFAYKNVKLFSKKNSFRQNLANFPTSKPPMKKEFLCSECSVSIFFHSPFIHTLFFSSTHTFSFTEGERERFQCSMDAKAPVARSRTPTLITPTCIKYVYLRVYMNKCLCPPPSHRSDFCRCLSVATLALSASHVITVETFRVSHIYFAKKAKISTKLTISSTTGVRRKSQSLPGGKISTWKSRELKIVEKLQVDKFPSDGSKWILIFSILFCSPRDHRRKVAENNFTKSERVFWSKPEEKNPAVVYTISCVLV